MAWPSLSARTKTWGNEVLTSADLDGQFDVTNDYINAALDATNGHGHTGGTSDGPELDLTLAVTGILPIANGGTNSSTLAGFLGNVYPVGCIYTTVNSTNPATVFGFGTWVTFGAGKVLIGFDSTDTDFNTVEQVGGEKNHTLTLSELPASLGTFPKRNGGGAGNGDPLAGDNLGSVTPTSGQITGGGGTGHNNLQPYIIVYFFKRTV